MDAQTAEDDPEESDMAMSDPWQGQAAVIGVAALIGAGVGAGSALMFVARRVDALAVQLDALNGRVARLEEATRDRRVSEAGEPKPAQAPPDA